MELPPRNVDIDALVCQSLRPTDIWVIRCNGNLVRLGKKSSWRIRQHALSALTNHIKGYWGYNPDFSEFFEHYSASSYSKRLIADGVIEVERLGYD